MVIRATALWLTFALIPSNPAFAQTQADPLRQMCAAFLNSSGVTGSTNPDVLCGCLVTEVQSQLSIAEMQSYQSSVAAGQPLPPAVEQKITAIAVRCLTAAR